MSFSRNIIKAAGFALAALGLCQSALAGVVTDVTVRDGSGTVIASNVRSFDWNEAGSGLAINAGAPGTLVVGQTFDFLYQANLVAFNGAGGVITPIAGLNESFGSGGYEFTVAARIQERVTNVIPLGGGKVLVTFESIGGTLSVFYDDATQGGAQSNTPTGDGFDDGYRVGLFNIRPGGNSNIQTTGATTAFGATVYDFDAVGTVDSAFIEGLINDIGDLHFGSNQELPPGTSTTVSFHNDSPSNTEDIYPTTPVTRLDFLLKVDGFNTFTAVPEPSILALLSIGLLGLGFGSRRRKV